MSRTERSDETSAAARGQHAEPAVSIIIPTYKREKLLIDTIEGLVGLLHERDEIVVVDQTPDHEPDVLRSLESLSAPGRIRWIRKATPNQGEAMNVGALVARGDLVIFLDDDIIPLPTLIEGHREALMRDDPPSASCGQVLQPWHDVPISEVRDLGMGFDAAYDRECEIMSLMAGNYAMRRETYLAIGGMDENFRGWNYRNDAEMAYRILARTGKKVRFIPEATLRHLLAGGGNRAFGAKDTWGNIGSSIGDYYFALKWLRGTERLGHIARRLVRAPLNRNTVKKPWLIVSLALREVVALFRAALRWRHRHDGYVRPLESYTDVIRNDREVGGVHG